MTTKGEPVSALTIRAIRNLKVSDCVRMLTGLVMRPDENSVSFHFSYPADGLVYRTAAHDPFEPGQTLGDAIMAQAHAFHLELLGIVEHGYWPFAGATMPPSAEEPAQVMQ